MAIFRRRTKDGPLLPEQPDGSVTPRSITAAAMPMAGPGVKIADRARKQNANSDWQKQGWYFYDVIGELRAPLVWIANAVSQADLHATELDPATGKPTGPSENPTAVKAAAQVLGGAAKRATLLKVLALCWQVPGEAWVIVRPRAAGMPDEWIVLPPSQVTTKGTGANSSWQYRDPKLGTDVPLDVRSRLFRVWSPHPADFIQADSAVRPALPICREIEQCSQTISAQLNSRIALAPIMLLADELDFPRGEHETSALALMDEVLSATEASIQSPGTPAAISPLGLNAPSDMIASGGALAFVSPTTEFVQGLDELRDKAIGRLHGTLEMPEAVAAGTQAEANHWSAWNVDEITYKTIILPMLREFGDAVTEHYFRPALVAMGMTPEQAATYEIGWDTTNIVARPDDRETLESLYDKVLISDEYMLTENGIPVDAMPSEEERERRLLEKWVTSSPAILSEPGVAETLGMPELAAAQASAAEQAPEPPQEQPRALPATQDEESEPEPVPDGLTAAAELLVFDALSRAGGRLLTRENRGQFTHVPKHEMHLVIHPGPFDTDRLMEGSFQFVGPVAEAFGLEPEWLKERLRDYVDVRLIKCKPHDREALKAWLQ